MTETSRDEVLRMHNFIESWLTGRAKKSNDVFAQFADALAEDFLLINPSGKADDKASITSGFWGAYGAQPEPFSVEIRDFKCRFATEDFCLAIYQEWQFGTETTARLSTVLFRRAAEADRLQWLHLHETWLDVRATTGD